MSTKGNFIDRNTGELRKSNGKFTQFMNENLHILRVLLRENPKICETFLFLVENMDKNNAIVISQNTLAEFMEISRTTAYRYIKYLKENNFLKIGKTGGVNVFILNEQIVWKNSAESREYAKFSATVYMSRIEQDKETSFYKELRKKI